MVKGVLLREKPEVPPTVQGFPPADPPAVSLRGSPQVVFLAELPEGFRAPRTTIRANNYLRWSCSVLNELAFR